MPHNKYHKGPAKRRSKYNHFSHDLEKASSGLPVARPNQLTNLLELRHSIDKAFKSNLSNYYMTRHNFSEALAKDFVLHKDVSGAPGDVKTHVDWVTGYFYYNMADFRLTYLLRNVDLVERYLDDLRRTFEGQNDVMSNLQVSRSHTYVYDTSFSFVPQAQLKISPMPDTYCKITQSDRIRGEHSSHFMIEGDNVCPVAGYLMTAEQAEAVLEKYDNHPFYSVYMQHVLFCLHKMGHNYRVKLGRREGFKLDDNMPYHMESPRIGKNTLFNAKVNYTGFHEITLYEQTNVVTLPFRANQHDQGVIWSMFHPELHKVVAKMPPGDNYDTHQITHLQLNIHTYTIAVRPLAVANKSMSWADRIVTHGTPKHVLAQIIEIDGHYHSSVVETFQPNCALRFVTANRGLLMGKHKVTSDLQAILYQFGYGLPYQAEIHDIKSSFFHHNLHNIPSEIPAYGMAKACRDMIDRFISTDDNSAALANNARPSVLKSAALDFSNADARTATTLLKSMKRNHQRRDLKESIFEERPVYHYNSICKQHFQFVVVGDPSPEPTEANRVAQVVLVVPIGDSNIDGYAPEWDYLTMDMDMDFEGAQQGNGSRPASAARTSRPASPKASGPASPRVTDSGGAASPRDGSISRPQVPPLRRAATERLARDKSMDTGSQLHSFFVEDDLDIEAIMRSAAQPSVFDEEVYM